MRDRTNDDGTPYAPPSAGLDLVDARDLLVLAFDSSPLGMTIATIPPSLREGARPQSLMINRAFSEMLGYSVEELLTTEDQAVFTHPADRQADLQQLQTVLSGDVSTAQWQKRYVHADGHVIWAEVAVSVLRGYDGKVRYLIAQVQDITRRREQEAELLDRAEHDALTGLLNRSAFAEHAQDQVLRCARYGERAALLMIDVDGLKQINDRHGHAVGDRALVEVADALRARLRDTDVAARIGGDEFVVLLPHTDPAEALRLAESVKATIEDKTVAADTADVPLAASVGAAEVTSTTDVEDALAAADREMYRAKRVRQQVALGGSVPTQRTVGAARSGRRRGDL